MQSKEKFHGFLASGPCRACKGKVPTISLFVYIERNVCRVSTTTHLPRMPSTNMIMVPVRKGIRRVRVYVTKPIISPISVFEVLFFGRFVAAIVSVCGISHCAISIEVIGCHLFEQLGVVGQPFFCIGCEFSQISLRKIPDDFLLDFRSDFPLVFPQHCSRSLFIRKFTR